MGKSVMKTLVEMEGQMQARDVAIKRLQAENSKLQRRLHAKSQEVSQARQSRNEALVLLREAAANDSALRERVIALLAADQLAEQAAKAAAALEASQGSIPGTEVSVEA